MIEAKFDGHRQYLPIARQLCCRKEHFLFHADMFEEPSTKRVVGRQMNSSWGRDCLIQQFFQPPVIIDEKLIKRSCHLISRLSIWV